MGNINNNSNAGFSFIEMLVSVLITGILMCAVGVFISMSNTIYQTVNTSSKVQEEANATKNFLSEILIESTNICSGVDSADAEIKYWIVKSMNNEDNKGKYVDESNIVTSAIDYDYYFIIYNGNDKKLRYVKVERDGLSGDDRVGVKGSLSSPVCNANNIVTGLPDALFEKYVTNEKNSKYNIISNKVSSFEISSTNLKSLGSSSGISGNYNLYDIEVTYEYGSKSFDSKFSVNSRNKADGLWNK